MTNEFITEGLNQDRYLKADKLVNRFREDVRQRLEEVSEDIIDSHGELFDEDVQRDYGYWGTDGGKTLATSRIEFDMKKEHPEYGPLKLNLAVEWVEPEEQNLECVTVDSHAEESPDKGSLCYVAYKIQRGSESTFETVKQQTKDGHDWKQVCFGDDQWPYKPKEAPGIVCVPVETGPELEQGLNTLKQHFGTEYAPQLSE